jgi:hypothetical protein
MKHFLVAFAILLEAIYALFASASDYRENLLPFFALSASAALLALLFAPRATLRSALLWGALFRATVALRAPDLSEDLYRYAWDGHVCFPGISPYARVPDDPAPGTAAQRRLGRDGSPGRAGVSTLPPPRRSSGRPRGPVIPGR